MNASNQGVGRCNRCETLPEKIEGSGRLYLWFPIGHTNKKVISAFNKAELAYQIVEEGKCLNINLDKSNRERYAELLTTKLTSKELKETQVLWMPELQEPQLGDFSRMISLDNFNSLSESEWLLDLLANERIISYFQPIVYTDNTSQIFAHEALLRGLGEGGNLIAPGRIFAQAEKAGLLFQLDALARTSAIREASRQGIKELVFINFSPTSVYDPMTCLRMTVRAIDEAGIPHNNIVFEVAESEQPPDIHHLVKILKFYQEAGFLVALDDFGSGYSNLNLIHQLRPDFIKLDMQLIRNVHQDPYKALITEKILEIAQQLEIRTIAEGIESLEELHWVQERGATFVQGYLVAKPASPPLTTTPYLNREPISLPA
ncbi:EAL domain-containing protein [Microcoleus sp. FACHB-672]|uniref:EAL domain-containing protein n=1 Tax=Microcoleus sp. FACHB-672 TaxID=2692825 RepID=UPI001684ACBE|nr:EAL domain-containing protein [Microcoleus sp. FACHB-672]MBD2041583.1 EAL domain-containing protein [Microcoleus sp. FACHB-672]